MIEGFSIIFGALTVIGGLTSIILICIGIKMAATKIYNSFKWIISLNYYHKHYYLGQKNQGLEIKTYKDNFFRIGLYNRALDPEAINETSKRLDWIAQNCKESVIFELENKVDVHKIFIGSKEQKENYIQIYFTDEKDAMAYKLRWS